MKREVSWNGCPQAMHKGISILPYLVTKDLIRKAVSLAVKTRQDTASMTKNHKFLSGN